MMQSEICFENTRNLSATGLDYKMVGYVIRVGKDSEWAKKCCISTSDEGFEVTFTPEFAKMFAKFVDECEGTSKPKNVSYGDSGKVLWCDGGVMELSTSSLDRTNMKAHRDTILSIIKSGRDGITLEELIKKSAEKGICQEKVEHIFDELKRNSVIYVTEDGQIGVV